MRRPTRRRGRRRREVLEEVAAPIAEDAHKRTDVARIRSGSTVKDVAEYIGVGTPEVIKKLMSLGEMATLTQTLSDEAIQVLADEFEKKIEIVHAADEVEEAVEYGRRRRRASVAARRSWSSWATSTTARRRCWTRFARPR